MRKNISNLFAHRKGESTTQDRIFRILVRSHPLTIAKLQKTLQEEYRFKLSYQAIRKAVGVLLVSGIAEKVEEGYQLSTKWLLNARSTIDEALQRYRSGSLHLTCHESYQLFEASTLHEADTLWGEILFQICQKIPRSQRGEIISINHYPWWLPFNLGREEVVWREIRNLGWSIRFVFTEKIPSTCWAKKIYKEMSIPVSFGLRSPIESTTYYNVFGDFIIRATLPDALQKKIAKAFSGKNCSLSPAKLGELGSLQSRIILEVFQSKVFALALTNSVSK